MELRSWPIFGLLDPQVISNIKIACVFGTLGHEAIFVTKSDEAYSMGSNSSGCLGVENLCSSLTPMKMDGLCNKKVKGFSFGAAPHVLAFTEEGELYAWVSSVGGINCNGHNGFSQLGIGSSCQAVVPTLVNGVLGSKKVVGAACGSHHSMVQTSDGEIYCFGQNSSGQVGCGSTANQPTPRRVSAVIGNSKVVSIACSQTSSFAVSDCGELFSWGYNGTSNLGLGTTVNQYNPMKVHFPQSVFIKKVVCGLAHTLALADDGSLFTFGANSYGQLGCGHKANVTHPVRIGENLGRIVDIAATHYGHLSVCQTHTKIFVFGQCRGQNVMTPIETPFRTMHEAFACFSSPPVTYKPIETIQQEELSICQALAFAFDDATTSDIQFVVDGKTIHAHKAILRIRCEHFRCMFNGKWEENQETVIPIELGVSYGVYKAFLQYIYTDRVDLKPEEAIDLLKLANYYCESKLRNECASLVKQSISVENAARLYESSISYNAGELKEFSFKYIMHHLTEVVKSQSFMELDGDLLKQLMVELGESGAFKY